VATATQERVLTAATLLGYTPDSTARMLATGRSSVVGLDLELDLVGEGILLNPYFSTVISSLSEAAVSYGFTFRLLPAEVRKPTRLKPNDMVGAIAVDPTSGNIWIPRMIESGIRVVCIGRYPGTARTSWVDNDHRRGMTDAVGHLADEGYERVVLMSVRQRSSLVIDLEESFRAAVGARGLKGKTVPIGEFGETTAHELSLRLLSSQSKPDAIIAANDRVAIGVLRAAGELGIGVPGALGVIGLGDTALAQRLQPGLSSIRSTPKELAEQAMRLIWEHWLDPSGPDKEILLPADLIVRGSSRRSTAEGASTA
jgi:LacI family transcriptional regulator